MSTHHAFTSRVLHCNRALINFWILISVHPSSIGHIVTSRLLLVGRQGEFAHNGQWRGGSTLDDVVTTNVTRRHENCPHLRLPIKTPAQNQVWRHKHLLPHPRPPYYYSLSVIIHVHVHNTTLREVLCKSFQSVALKLCVVYLFLTSGVWRHLAVKKPMKCGVMS